MHPAYGGHSYSVARASNTLGLHPTTGSRVVETDAHHRMSPTALDEALAECAREGLIPMAIVATSGTTDLGAIDPLASIAPIAHKHRVHLHVDAAYGGAMLVSPTQRHRLQGIESADSVTVDFHKTYFQPVACSAVVLRNPEDLAHISWHADYLNPQDTKNSTSRTAPQTTRRFDALSMAHPACPAPTQSARLSTPAAITSSRPPRSLTTHLELFEQPQLTTLLFRPTTRTPPHRGSQTHAARRGGRSSPPPSSRRRLKCTILVALHRRHQHVLDLVVDQAAGTEQPRKGDRQP